jgi:hypothetical protein
MSGLAAMASVIAPTRTRRSARLRGLVFRHRQDRTGQMTVGEPKFIENREVVGLGDGNQSPGR